jgi:hypothetical protein
LRALKEKKDLNHGSATWIASFQALLSKHNPYTSVVEMVHGGENSLLFKIE